MTGITATPESQRRLPLRAFVEHPLFQRTIIALIVVNAVVLGLETSAEAMAAAGDILVAIDQVILAVFVVEIVLRLAAYGVIGFFRNPWSVFDFLVVAVALVPASEGFAILRALRVLRVLRLMSTVPQMRRVVSALLGAIPGLASIVALLGLIFYVAAVMATTLFRDAFPEWFGTLGASLYTLFQVMTLESWSMGIVRPVMAVHPYAWAFFIPFILIATFTILNLFIAVVVNAMQAGQEEKQARTEAAIEAVHQDERTLQEELSAMRAELAQIRALMERRAD
jgi:voltage-gated sodium channel